MSPFVPPAELVVHETAHWRVNHRCDTIYPGYLMVAAKDTTVEALTEMSPVGLSEVGGLLAASCQALRKRFDALKVYCALYGHEPGHTAHFHVIPLYDWTLRLFEQNNSMEPKPDGADLVLFVCRHFAERGVQPPRISGPQVSEVVRILREEFRNREKAEPAA